MKKIFFFNQKSFLDQLGVCISKNNYEESLQKLKELCINSPFNTQAFIQVFIRAWCEKILNMLNNDAFENARLRINSLYMLIKHNSYLNKLINIYFEKINKKEIFSNLKDNDKAIYLSMQSQYFYQINKHDDAEKCVQQCLDIIIKISKRKKNSIDFWLLLQKSLKNVKNKKKSEIFLKKILENYEN